MLLLFFRFVQWLSHLQSCFYIYHWGQRVSAVHWPRPGSITRNHPYFQWGTLCNLSASSFHVKWIYNEWWSIAVPLAAALTDIWKCGFSPKSELKQLPQDLSQLFCNLILNMQTFFSSAEILPGCWLIVNSAWLLIHATPPIFTRYLVVKLRIVICTASKIYPTVSGWLYFYK